ncbi:hypothetical protein, partial [Rhizobium leguminosarum]|uniref:hypothetical protein n=1 Tax=Rhizobium leguminosarum TaxID=384 RepID=UPI003F9CCF2C
DVDMRQLSGTHNFLHRPIYHVKPMRDTHRKAAGYVLKSVERLRIGSGEILILPRVHSEMNSRVGVLGTTSGAETMFR